MLVCVIRFMNNCLTRNNLYSAYSLLRHSASAQYLAFDYSQQELTQPSFQSKQSIMVHRCNLKVSRILFSFLPGSPNHFLLTAKIITQIVTFYQITFTKHRLSSFESVNHWKIQDHNSFDSIGQSNDVIGYTHMTFQTLILYASYVTCQAAHVKTSINRNWHPNI